MPQEKIKEAYNRLIENGVLRLNVSRLPDPWWRKGISEEVTKLLIHEIGHYRGLHHLSEEYHRTITEIGAKLTMLALNRPDKFKEIYHGQK